MRRPDHHAFGRELAGGGFLRRLGDSEVGDEHVTGAVEQHVVGLHVAVHDTAAVRVGQGVRDLARDPGGVDHGEPLIPLE